jgi:hypothetical protein
MLFIHQIEAESRLELANKHYSLIRNNIIRGAKDRENMFLHDPSKLQRVNYLITSNVLSYFRVLVNNYKDYIKIKTSY